MTQLARCCVGVALVAASASAQREKVWIPRPFFELRLENARIFNETRYAPLFAGLGEVMAGHLGIEGEDGRGKLEDLWDGLDWPVEVMVMLDRVTELPVGGVWMPASSPSLFADLLTLSSVSQAAHQEFELDGAPFASAQLTGTSAGPFAVSLSEGVLDGRRLLFLGHPDSVGEPVASIPKFVRIAERDTPSRRLLAKHAEGGDIGWVFHVRSLLSAISDEEWRFAQVVLKVAIGPRFTGISGRMRATEGGIELDLYADIRPGSGWVGNLLWREPRDLAAAGWIPDGASDWVALDISVDSIVRVLNQFSMFGGGPDAGDLHHDLDWLDGIDLEKFLDTHFTGQVFAATEVGIETQFDDLDDLDGTVLGLGSFDGHELLAAAVELVRDHSLALGDDETHLRESPAHGPGIHTLVWEGEVRLLLAAQQDMVFACSPGRASAEMLRKVLATGGRGTLVAPDQRVCTMVGRGHVLEHLLAGLDATQGLGQGDGSEGLRDQLPQLLESFLAEHGGLASWRVVVDGDGTRLQVRL